MRKAPILLMLLLAGPLAAEDAVGPPTGTHLLLPGPKSPPAGKVTVAGEPGTRLLSFAMANGASRSPLREDPDRSTPGRIVFLRDQAAEEEGLSGALGGGGGDTLEAALVRLRDGWGLEYRDGPKVIRRERLAPCRGALVVHAVEGEAGPLARQAQELARTFNGLGLQAEVLPARRQADLLRRLEQAAPGELARLVWIGPGGRDGPLLGGTPIPAGGEDWERLTGAIQRATSPDARLFAATDHAAGSGLREPRDPRRWVVALAKATGRTVAGPAGPTAPEHALAHVRAALEGRGAVFQEVYLAGPEGVRWLPPNETLAGAREPPGPPREVAPDAPGSPVQAGRHLGRARAALESGDVGAAIDEARRAVAADPSDREARKVLAEAERRLGASR